MDFINIWENIAGRNPMFLAATGSVALGITLIITAGIVQLKRFQARSRHVSPVEKPLMSVDLENITNSTDHGDVSTENPELRPLLARLRAAADKLEKLTEFDGRNPVYPSDSPLKREPSGVDYIFRAGTG